MEDSAGPLRIQGRNRGEQRDGVEADDGHLSVDGALSVHLRSSFASLRPRVLVVLDAWMARSLRGTPLTAPSKTLSSSTHPSSSSLVHRPLSAQLDDLVRDREALRRRTQIDRGGGGRGGGGRREDGEEGEDGPRSPISHPSRSFIFDDSDFYGHLLQELLSSSSHSASHSSSLSASLSLPIRRPSLRPPVDRRASKGRKLRFSTIPALRQFMAPTAVAVDDSAIDQLFARIFGQHRTGAKGERVRETGAESDRDREREAGA